MVLVTKLKKWLLKGYESGASCTPRGRGMSRYAAKRVLREYLASKH